MKNKQLDAQAIIFEDQDLLVINKAAGVVVNNAATVQTKTIQEMMEEYLGEGQDGGGRREEGRAIREEGGGRRWKVGFGKQKQGWQDLLPADFSDEWGSPEEIFASRSGIVHRLDKDTSGVLVLAKNPGSLINLLDQFKKRLVSKKYLCLVHGKFKLKQGEVTAPLGRSRKDRKKFAVKTEGRAAVTAYKVIEEFDFENFQAALEKIEKLATCSSTAVNSASIQTSTRAFSTSPKETKLLKKSLRTYQQGLSLVQCFPRTGRTHQIRVHMKHLDHPLVGDSVYTGRKRTKLDAIWCPRQFLHASEIEFVHPRSKKKVNFKAELTEDLKQVLTLLDQKM